MDANGGSMQGMTPLERPMPNPFTNGMHMAFAVGDGGDPVDISVYDVTGRKVKQLAGGVYGPGRHDVAWDGRDASGLQVRRGMYFIHIRIGSQARQVRVTFVN
jgi:flagellar hook assembly protein FlgD